MNRYRNTADLVFARFVPPFTQLRFVVGAAAPSPPTSCWHASTRTIWPTCCGSRSVLRWRAS